MSSAPSIRRPRWRVILGIVIGTPVVLIVAYGVSRWLESPRRVTLPPPPPSHSPRLVVEPARVDLGRRSQCDGLVRVKGTLRNASSEPATLSDWIASCGCTTPTGELRKGMTLAPGESRDFEVTSDSWAISGEKKYSLDFIEAFADAPVRFHIHYIVESPLHSDVGHLVRIANEVTAFTVKSRDKQPFRILAVEPAIAAFDSAKGSAEQELRVSWIKADAALGANWIEQELVIKTDREDCPELHLRLQGTPVEDVPETPAETVRTSSAAAAPR